MKIILSRKGFDSSAGGCASPILPDGTLLSLPIPGVSKTKYSDISYRGEKYSEIIEKLNHSFFESNVETCHLDPDIRKNVRRNPIADWQPAFGQTDNAQGQLRNAGVDVGDIFLFFGWFHSVDENYRYIEYKKRNPTNDFYRYAELQVVYGYMQVGKIINDPEEIKNYYWHPHSEGNYGKNNTLYIPSEKLLISGKDYGSGYGILDFDEKRVLTKEHFSRANWERKEFLLPDKVYGDKKNSSSKPRETIYYAGQWQELVINESPGLLEWVVDIIKA